MSRFQADQAPKPEMPTPAQIVEFWNTGKLPPELRDDELGLVDSVQEKLDDLEAQLGETAGKKKFNETILAQLQAGEEDTNNFYLTFLPRVTLNLQQGQWELLNSYALRPFVINQKYNGAWNAMCEALPDQVRVLIEWAAHMKGGHPKVVPEVLRAAQQLALYLHAKGVPLSFLWV